MNASLPAPSSPTELLPEAMKNDLVKFYEDMRRTYNAYHNHKEVSAWAALVLHLTFCAALLRFKSEGAESTKFSVILTLYTLVQTTLICIYMDAQFVMKEEGAAFSAAATILQLRLIRLKSYTVRSLHNYARLIPPSRRNDDYSQAEHCLPEMLLRRYRRMLKKGAGAHRLTRRIAITMPGFVTTMFLLGRWFYHASGG